jgi:hypothetical protein
MELSFENHHVVAVLVFMVALLFCKQALECMHSVLQLWQTCAASACCCHYGQQELVRGGLLATLLTFSVCQPIIFVLVNAVSTALRGRQGFWTVNFVHIELNISSFPHRHSQAETLRRPLADSVSVSTTPVDGMLLVMPFALSAFCTTYSWFSMKAAGDFSSDPLWDMELFQHRRMQVYEALYALETWLLLFALMALTADPAQLEYTLVCALLATFIHMYFSAQSRCKSAADHASESVISIMLFATLNTLLSAFVTQHWSAVHPVKMFSAFLLAFTTLTLAGLHMAVTEDVRAGHVILLRTLISCVSSVFFIVLLAVDANSLV